MPKALPLEQLQAQLEALELVQSLFALEGEVEVDERSLAAMAWIAACGGDVEDLKRSGTDALAFRVNVALEPEDEGTFPLVLSVRLPLVDGDGPVAGDGAPYATVSLQQPPWMSRAAHDSLGASLPSSSLSFTSSANPVFSSNGELLLQTLEHVREEGAKLIPTKPDPSLAAVSPTIEEPEFRVWLWFMSLSTREKRDDIVNWAPDFGLTGFVLAGKPGVMCLEGTENGVQAFLSDIKSKSWADIPSFQKKVTERYRTPLLSSSIPPSAGEDPTLRRLFTNMSEITSLIPQGGHRGQRNEMGVVKAYLEEQGLGEAFGLVIGGGQFA
ncbi:hypothetical protein JCM8547_006203 [Rhodosporidiobolus lusitaniae]